MFDVYIQEQSIDPRLRKRMLGAVSSALTVTACAGMIAWGADKMKVGSVAPPKSNEVVMLSLNPPLPKAEVPDRPEQDKAVTPDPSAVKKANPRPEQPDDFLETPSKPRRHGSGTGTDDTDGDPSGTGEKTIGVPGSGSQRTLCPPGMLCDKAPPPTSTTPPTPKPKPPLHVDLRELRPLFSPNPPQAKLRSTKTGLTTRRAGTVVISFCTDARGTVATAKVKRRFPGDPSVDRIALKTVRGWRFKPFAALGKARKACSEVSFQIRFD